MAAQTPARTYGAAVKRFLKAADYLTDEDAPAVTTLVLLAKQLDDKGHHAQTVAAFGLAYRALLKRGAKDSSSTDPLEALLDD